MNIQSKPKILLIFEKKRIYFQSKKLLLNIILNILISQ